jgi:hypothetical protein
LALGGSYHELPKLKMNSPDKRIRGLKATVAGVKKRRAASTLALSPRKEEMIRHIPFLRILSD